MTPKWWTDPDGTAHAWLSVQVWIKGTFYGEFPFDPGAHPELRWRRSSVAYFCNRCGDVWARLLFIEPLHNEVEAFGIVTNSCEQHWDQWNVAGSLLTGELENFLPLLPAGVLRRELELHLRQEQV